MKIKLDENLPSLLVPPLTALGHDVHSVEDEGLTGVSDEELWRVVQNERRLLITQDMAFADGRRFPAGSH